MGSIGGAELPKMDNMQIPSAREEKILVLVRLRPLNDKEIVADEVADWECLNDTTILYRNTLREGSTFPSAYTFDRVFRGDSSTRQVYDEGAKEVALSVVSGINSSIFAYGQTSSGKTYTMIGITEYTVADIFDYIHRHEERAFVLKFSAIEIYNEAIRDLLSADSTPLRLLDDPEKGTVVEKVTEETLKDWNHLQELLSICEAQRRIGETSLNEKSSRSHQILRLTIESSAREFLGKENSTTLAATVQKLVSPSSLFKTSDHRNDQLENFHEICGSGNLGDDSKGRHGHINYRDSKLTRLLQPALGGNARTAIICTLSPARSHVEQTRNTLLFACCAKEVTTKAQVNVVMSDKALVKHLQKELARLESELRSPAPASSTSDYGTLLRKKDLQIQKMEKEIRELKKQRDLAESRIEDLLQMIGQEQTSRNGPVTGHHPKQATNTWEDECSVSESSGVVDPHYLYEDDHSDGTSSLMSIGKKIIRSNSCQSLEDTAVGPAEDADDYCREVQCIEIDETRRDNYFEPHSISSAAMSSPTNMKLTRSWSCRENLMSTPPNGFEKSFTGRPESVRRRFPPLNYGADAARLLRNDSQSSLGSAYTEDFGSQSVKTSADDDIPSIRNFVEGLKEMAKQETDPTAEKFGKNAKDVGLDPMCDALDISSDWSLTFERQRSEILELWQTCNVSLVHRTYFFLLFKGDPTDSIYMEVELRRLSFLKENFSQGNQALGGGGTFSFASSIKALHRERGMLSKLMQKRLSEEERKRFYQKWGIGLNSKRRRLQLANRLWSNTKDINHIMESAAIVAKLVKFVEQGQALKEMFGLSFTPPSTRRRSLGWTYSKSTLM
ncbi:ATP binding protein, putative [Ricinus communis]|uniref:ATP binding protein, putative n=1 Tax=Ricinus communis TaxID=3988 RepID=B9RHD8_RICCO|nr:ATP binding protein, putative [Ricinus communis]